MLSVPYTLISMTPNIEIVWWCVSKVCGIHLLLRIPLTFCGILILLRNPKQLVIFACCGMRDTTNVPTKFTLLSYVRGFHRSFVSRIHLHFGTCLNTSFWNPGTYRHKIVRLSSAQLGLVMMFFSATDDFIKIEASWVLNRKVEKTSSRAYMDSRVE